MKRPRAFSRQPSALSQNKYFGQVADFIGFNENFFAFCKEVTEKESIGIFQPSSRVCDEDRQSPAVVQVTGFYCPLFPG
jgi:hypothetical protein